MSMIPATEGSRILIVTPDGAEAWTPILGWVMIGSSKRVRPVLIGMLKPDVSFARIIIGGFGEIGSDGLEIKNLEGVLD